RGVRCMASLLGGDIGRLRGPRLTRPRRPGSEARQALRAVVRDGRAGDLVERAVGLDGVADKLRRVGVKLVQVRAVGRQPVITGTAADGSVQRPEGAIPWYLRARGVLGDRQHVSVDPVTGDVAVAEVGRERPPVIGGYGEPA